MAAKRKAKKKPANKGARGKLRIGDTWNAITIIALSQNDPLKAIAEFVENSIDAKAKNITITRGKEKGEAYIRIADDGEGIPANDNGEPDFKYVATHICDSIKKQMKEKGVEEGLQGEFGIGLLSFWTVGEALHMTSTGPNGKAYEMSMVKGDQAYEVTERRTLFPVQETELLIKPLLPGVRSLNGEKIQWYLASELRDRIRSTGVNIKVIDRTARKEFTVEPRLYTGNLLPVKPIETAAGEIYFELYLAGKESGRSVSLSRNGTRVLPDITSLSHFKRDPWSSGFLEGIIDAPFLRLSPGTRDGFIQDEVFDIFRKALRSTETTLIERIDEIRHAEEQRASKQALKSVQSALREALQALPEEEYDQFDIRKKAKGMPSATRDGASEDTHEPQTVNESPLSPNGLSPKQKEFFEYEGALFSAQPNPASCAVQLGTTKILKANLRDKSRRTVTQDINLIWSIIEGDGLLSDTTGEEVTFTPGDEPGLVRIQLIAQQHKIRCTGEALITVTESDVPELIKSMGDTQRGLPGYTFETAAGELWRARYNEEENLVIINDGHRDFIYASRQNARKLRYIARLFAKELVIRSFPELPPEQMLERMIELSLYTEDHLRY